MESKAVFFCGSCVMLTCLEVGESMYLSEIPWESRLWFQISVIFTPTCKVGPY